ncbi:hypothetical protein SCLCIDRAFT_33163 [Scleroderma citrinum Foug A]|uniref:Uncharacterized protein n=1 Tax=Scleroderma citrinum Foug A TaxID=1036808 RepID=A0A0C2ZFZ7_9AGAM|nr:hypothetical protein SCLCIDRAFT_33163 [Scleroderma citrinum Foug A]
MLPVMKAPKRMVIIDFGFAGVRWEGMMDEEWGNGLKGDVDLLRVSLEQKLGIKLDDDGDHNCLQFLLGNKNKTPQVKLKAYYLHAYIIAPKEAKRSLMTNDCEILLSCVLVLPAQPSHNDHFQGCAQQSLTGLHQAINTADVIGQATHGSDRVLTAIAEALYATDNSETVVLLFGDLPHLHHFKPRSPTLTPPSVVMSPPPAQIIIDPELTLSADPTRYPHPIVLGRLINGLDCTHDIPALEPVYSIAQQVLFSPYFIANPAWQTVAWFQIEDQ